MGETLFELEHAYDRDELAAIFREFAVALEAETPVELHSGDRQLTIDLPADVVAELEGEREDGRTELEFELEWDDPDGTGIRVTDVETGDEAGDANAEGETEDVETTAVEENATGEEGSDRVETSESPGRRSRFEVYEDRAEEWRWRLVHWNGNVIADSGEGYASRSNAERAARGVMRNAPSARIERRDG